MALFLIDNLYLSASIYIARFVGKTLLDTKETHGVLCD